MSNELEIAKIERLAISRDAAASFVEDASEPTSRQRKACMKRVLEDLFLGPEASPSWSRGGTVSLGRQPATGACGLRGGDYC